MKDRLPASAGPASATPTEVRTHGMRLRGLESVVSSFSTAGRFGRMFRNVPVLEHGDENIPALARTMILPAAAAESTYENPVIPAGYTYLGQFVDHDLTFDPVSSLQRQNDPEGLHNFRTPRFDLDSLYGRGPSDQPYLYRNGAVRDPHPRFGFEQRGVMLLEGERRGDPNAVADAAMLGPDLPRNREGRALIGDPRNDENLIVAQLHAIFIKFHNRMVEYTYDQTGLTGNDLLKEAQRLVRWHYQWVVVTDFLPRVVDGDPGDGTTEGSGVVSDILGRDSYCTSDGKRVELTRPHLRFYHWHEQPFIPVEFSVAAFRFGHSMVRPSYLINDQVRRKGNDGRVPVFSDSTDPLANLSGHRPLPDHWGIQWKYFFELDPAMAPQRSFKIDTMLSAPLGTLPDYHIANLAERNLLRGLRLGVPSGQKVARAMGIQPLSDADLGLNGRGAPDFDGDAPLWFYVLREAELLARSQHLGPVGGRIVAEVVIGILAGDPLSWLNVEPNWQPPLARHGRFGMPELLAFISEDPAAGAARTSSSIEAERWRSELGFH